MKLVTTHNISYKDRKSRLDRLIDNLWGWYDYLETLPNVILVQQWQDTCHPSRKDAMLDEMIREKHLRMGHTGGVIEGLKLMKHVGLQEFASATGWEEYLKLAEDNWAVKKPFFKETITKTGE